MNLREAAQQALETCTDVVNGWESLAPLSVRRAAIESLDALRAALTEPEQEPVAWWNGNSKFAIPKAKDWDKRTGGTTAFGCDIPLYTAPTPRKPLTGEEIKQAVLDDPIFGAALMSLMRDEVMVAQLRQAVSGIARAIERAHGIGEQT